MANILTAFFSLKGETIAPGMKIVNLEKGNTNVVAEFIHDAVGGDLFEIETIKTYKKDHFEMIEEAKQELQQQIMVELKGYPENMKAYNVLFLGFPNWWNTIPMPVKTFLTNVDLAGKKIIPFCTSEGSGFGRSVDDIKKICPNAIVQEGLSIKGSQAINSEEKVLNWAKGMM